MKALLDWGKQLIGGLAQFLVTVFSFIANAMKPDYHDPRPGVKQVKSIVIFVNKEGVVSLRKVNDEVLGNCDKGSSARSNAQSAAVMSATTGDSPCCEVYVVDGKIYCVPVPCP